MISQEIIKEFENNPDIDIIENESMANHCYIKTGGVVRGIVFPKTVSSLIFIIKFLNDKNIKYKIIGRGSNIILPDQDLDIIFIKISNALDHLNFFEDGQIDVGSGYSLQKLAKVLSKKGYTGLEFAGGIPGTLGGAIYMNAGAHLKEIKDIIKEVTFLDENLEVKTLKKDDCKFSYRHSLFQENIYIILGAKLKMSQEDPAQVFKKMLGNLEYRKEMQPLNMPTFGSVFKNPPGQHAGKLIEEVGLKGYQIGGAKVSNKHANFIENIGGATAKDITDLIQHIKSEVKLKKNVDLITEVEIFKGE